MSETPQSAVRTSRRTRAVWVVLLLVAGLALGGGLGYQYALGPGRPTDVVTFTQAQVEAQDAVMRQHEAESRFLRSQLDTADGELAVERAARQELESQLRTAQEEVGRVRDQLAFYEQLLPPGPAGSIDIRAADIVRAGNGLRYRVLLMRSGRSESAFSGELRFQAHGVEQGQSVTVDLQPQQVKTDEAAATPGAVLPAGAADATAPASNGSEASSGANGTNSPTPNGGLLTLHFDQFQRSQGLLSLPEGFVPESVTVTVLEGSTVRATRNVKLEF